MFPFALQPWEVEKALPRHLQTEVNLIGMEPHKLAIELAHKAAFRTGLGRSIYCSDIALKKINPDLLQVNRMRSPCLVHTEVHVNNGNVSVTSRN